jgi:hypothetical protein
VKLAKRPQVTEYRPAGSVESMGESWGGVGWFCRFDGREFGKEFRD